MLRNPIIFFFCRSSTKQRLNETRKNLPVAIGCFISPKKVGAAADKRVCSGMAQLGILVSGSLIDSFKGSALGDRLRRGCINVHFVRS